jgi:N-acetylglucosamine-6-phosphate deacetylase
MAPKYPKYIDLQVNGHGGIDLLSAKNAEEVRQVSRSLYNNGVLSPPHLARQFVQLN